MAPRTRRLAAPARRATIIEAAGPLFGERGYDGTRLDDIAAAAGVTKPILYRHFASKRELYLALLARHRDDLQGFVDRIPAEGSVWQRLRAVVEVWIDYVEAHWYAWKMLFRDQGGGPEIAAFRVEVHARARAVLAGVITGLGDSAIPRRQVEPLAELMSMGMAALALWWLETPGVSRDAVIDAITRAWVGVLG